MVVLLVIALQENASMPSAEYMRHWRRTHGLVKGRPSPLPTPQDEQRRGQELSMMMRDPVLEWSEGLFTDDGSGTRCCASQCTRSHNHAVSRVVGKHGSRRVLWYCTIACRNRHAAL